MSKRSTKWSRVLEQQASTEKAARKKEEEKLKDILPTGPYKQVSYKQSFERFLKAYSISTASQEDLDEIASFLPLPALRQKNDEDN